MGIIKRLKRAVKSVRQNLDWLRDPSAGGRMHLPPFLSEQGRSFASTGQAFLINLLWGWGVGGLKWGWGKLTEIPYFLLGPLLDFHSSTDYRWRTLIWGSLTTVGAGLLWLLKVGFNIAREAFSTLYNLLRN